MHDILPDNGKVQRARVIVDSGSLAGKEGWVTMVGKDGSCALEEPATGVEAYTKSLPKEALEAARAAFAVFDVDGSGSLSTAELKEVSRE